MFFEPTAFICSNLAIITVEQSTKYVQKFKKLSIEPWDVVLVFEYILVFLLSLNM